MPSRTKKRKKKESLHKLGVGPQCQNYFSVDPDFHRKVRKLMKSAQKEHGGDTIVRFSEGTILPASMQVGQFDRVDLTRGVIDWHTHPGRCINSGKTCTVGLPSPADMANILQGAFHGTLAHMVYSREGTYAVQVKLSQRGRVRSDSVFRARRMHEVNQSFNILYSDFSRTPHETFRAGAHPVNMSYPSFQKAFMRLADQEGFCVTFFKGDTVPRFKLHFNCSAISAGPGLSATFAE